MVYSCIHPYDVIKEEYSFLYVNFQKKVLPSKIGCEGVGQVVWVGSKVQDYKIGDYIQPYFPEQYEAWQQYVVCEKGLLKFPNNIPLQSAAQLYTNPMAVVGLMNTIGFDLTNNKQIFGGWIAFNGANGTMGVKTLALVRKEDAVSEMKKLGATKVLVTGQFNNKEEYTKAIIEATEGKGVTVGLDQVGSIPAMALLDSVIERGQFISLGFLSGEPFDFEKNNYPNPNNVHCEFYHFPNWLEKTNEDVIEACQNYVLKSVQDGTLKLPVEQIFAFEDFKHAFDFQLNNKISRKGKILFKFE